jgi:hypothetical protein
MPDPRPLDFVREYINDARQTLRGELEVLDEMAASLTSTGTGGDVDVTLRPPVEAPKTGKSAHRTGRSSVRKMAEERRRKVWQLLIERGEPMSPREIKAVVPMNQSQAGATFKSLIEAEKIRRLGKTTAPTYEAIVEAASTPLTTRPPERLVPKEGGTKSGQILDYLTSTDEGATLEAVAEHLNLTVDEARAECGKLIREGEIRFRNSGGTTRYVPDPSA